MKYFNSKNVVQVKHTGPIMRSDDVTLSHDQSISIIIFILMT